jgi:hypothetical protein
MSAMHPDPSGGPERRIKALVPPELPRRSPPQPLVLPPLPAIALPSNVDPDAVLLDAARLDGSGRISARTLLAELDWPPGQRLQATVVADAVLIYAAPNGAHRVGSRGDLPVPGPARDLTGLHPRDLVVLVASPQHQLLIVHPAAVVTRLLTDLYTRQSREHQ